MRASGRILVGLRGYGQPEDDSVIVVLLLSGGEIEIGQRNFAGMSGCQIEKRFANDRVVDDFNFASVFEDEKRGLLRRLGRIRVGCLSFWTRVFHWRNVGVGSRSAPVEDRGTSLIVGIIVGIGICRADVNGV